MRTSRLITPLLALGLCASLSPARAASYRLGTDQVLIDKADAIVRGRVIEVTPTLDPDGGIHTDITLSVERTLKGHVGSPVVVVRQPGGTVGDRSDVYPGIGSFTPDDQVVVMLTGRGAAPYLVTDFAMGNFTVLHTADGTEFLRREGLRDAFLLGSESSREAAAATPANAAPGGKSPGGATSDDPDRDARLFERYIEGVEMGLAPAVDYVLPALQTPDTARIAEFVFLGTPPARWTQFDTSTTVTYKDNAAGDSGSFCQPDGCHAQVNTGMLKWNAISGTQILLAYGGVDNTIGSKCLNSLDNQIQFNDPCGEIPDLSGCSGTLALGGFSSTTSSGGSPSCPSMGNPSFTKIANAKILVNNGTGSCFNACDYTEMIAHETGHTLGAGHSPDGSALMHASLNHGLCGTPRSDDIAFAQCVYPQIALTCNLTATKTWGGPPPVGVGFNPGIAGGVGPYTYDYQFGDGTTDAGATPLHTYASASTFNATLTVNDNNGQNCTDSLDVTIQPCAPPTTASVTPKAIAGGLFKAIVAGNGFKKGAIMQVDSGSGYVAAPQTAFKSKKKLVAKDIGTVWPAGVPVQVRVVGPDGCPSNPLSLTR